jgi:hypothetical protein
MELARKRAEAIRYGDNWLKPEVSWCPSPYGPTVAQTTQVCTAQLPAFPPLDSRPVAIHPVPASVGRLVERNVLATEPVKTPPPPTARLPAGQSCCWLFGLLLLDAPLPEVSCRPLAPGGPLLASRPLRPFRDLARCEVNGTK